MFSYTGTSMFPTLKAGDILRVDTNKQRETQVGDVITFHSPYGGAFIVHRVISVNGLGVRTKGDNNLRNDDWVLSPNNIVGKIVSVRRGRKTVVIHNGFWGQKYVLVIRVLNRINGILRYILLSPIYHWLSETGILKKSFSLRLKTRLCCFKRGDDMELQLLLGPRIIGRLLPGQRQWYIMHPFKLFVDEAALPGINFGDLVSSRDASLKPQQS